MARSIRPRLARNAREPLPIIGVGRALRQGDAHDDALPHAAFPYRPAAAGAAVPRPRMACFSSGVENRWIRGLRAENLESIGIGPVHTRVDSCGLRGLRAARSREFSRSRV